MTLSCSSTDFGERQRLCPSQVLPRSRLCRLTIYIVGLITQLPSGGFTAAGHPSSITTSKVTVFIRRPSVAIAHYRIRAQSVPSLAIRVKCLALARLNDIAPLFHFRADDDVRSSGWYARPSIAAWAFWRRKRWANVHNAGRCPASNAIHGPHHRFAYRWGRWKGTAFYGQWGADSVDVRGAFAAYAPPRQ